MKGLYNTHLGYVIIFYRRETSVNVLLVYPKYPDTFWSFTISLRFVNKKAGFPPLGLLTIASMMPVEWRKKLVDMNVESLTDAHIEQADYVFISAMIVQEQSVNEVIRRCKEKGKKVIAGGPLFTSQHQKTEGVDIVFIGEVEDTFSCFLSDLKAGCLKSRYESSEKPLLDRTPLPDWSLVDLKNYATPCIQYSRGCPYLCDFCDIRIMFGQKPRVKTKQQFIHELECLYRAGWKGTVFIVDDNFIGNKQKIKELLLEVIEWQEKHGFPFQFSTQTDITLGADDEFLELMSKANFFQVFIGVETPSEESLKECSKGQNVRCDVGKAIRNIQKKGINVLIGIIVGFDQDCHYTSSRYGNIFDAIIGSVQEWGTPAVMAGILSVLPGTELEQRLAKEKRLLPNRANGENADFLTFIPTIPAEELVAGYHKILTTIYSPKNYYERVKTFLGHYHPTVRRKGVNIKDIRAFLLSILVIGFSKSGYYFWKMLLETLMKKPKALPEAIGSSIWHVHFRGVVKRITSHHEAGKI